MKISMFKFYKSTIIFCSILGIFTIVGSIIFTIYYYSGVGLDDYIMLFLVIPIGIGVSLFPIIINYKQLTHVFLEHDKCISYSLLRKNLCQINFNESVFYSFFDVRFLYEPPIRFIALSNMSFKCVQDTKSIFEKKFYGTYNQKQIIIFPYDDQVVPLLNLDNWHRIN